MSLEKGRWQRTEDVGLTVFLILVSVYLPLLIACSESATETGTLLRIFMSVLFLSAAFTAVQNRVIRVWAMTLSLTAVLGQWLPTFVSDLKFDTFRLLSALLLFAVITVSLAQQTFRSGRITGHHVRGAVAVYLLLGLMWSFAYALLDLYVPDSFAVASHANRMSGRFQELVYFSFVTLTTVGYGDMAPSSAPARSLAIVEAIAGQMYLAVVLARLVSMELSQRSGKPTTTD